MFNKNKLKYLGVVPEGYTINVKVYSAQEYAKELKKDAERRKNHK